MPAAKPIRRTPPKNLGLLKLVRAKQAWHWEPTLDERRKGFQGWHQRGFLPHFDAPNVTQFVTFQLNDAFPVRRRPEFEDLLKQAGDSVVRRKIETWLDRGHGDCSLRQTQIAELVEQVLLKDHGQMYRLQAWVIMPNHVHLVVDVRDVPLANLIHRWKGATSREANKLLGRRGAFWQLDFFDTLIKDENHLKRAVRYTEQNPMKAFKLKTPSDWPWSSARFRDEFQRLVR